MRNVGPSAVGLTNDQEVVVTKARSSENLDVKTCSRVIGVVNANKLRELFTGTMSRLRRVPARAIW